MYEEIESFHQQPLQSGSITEEKSQILRKILLEKENILIVGEKGSGKTKFINWILKNLHPEETILLFDYYNEINKNNFPGKSYVAGYAEESDIVGIQTHINPHKEMVSKALLLPFDRVVADELFVLELQNVIRLFHGNRSGIFSFSFDNPENALKHIFHETMYPDTKRLTSEMKKQASKIFKYAIIVKSDLQIQEILYHGDELIFKDIS